MKVINSPYSKHELPFNVEISFEKIYDFIEERANDKSDFYHEAAGSALKEFNKYPFLKEGFSDFSLLKTYGEQVSNLLDLLFPELLRDNEIKAASIPFEFTCFKFSKRFLEILENAGDDYVLEIRNFEEDKTYILACTFIIGFYYQYYIDFKRPFFFDIPNKKTGEVKHYRVNFNGDFSKVIKTDKAPEITHEDILSLLDNFDNIEKWKEFFPPNSYTLKGFGLMTLFDVTQDEMISNLKANLLNEGEDTFEQIKRNLATIFNIPNLHFGFTVYDTIEKRIKSVPGSQNQSLILDNDLEVSCTGYFCDGILTKVFNEHKIVAISDMESYAKAANENGFSKSILSKNIKSVILVPLASNGNLLGVMTLGSEKTYELNSINANKLKDIIPIFTLASARAMDEHHNRLESIIQENYTSIHPSVKWRFYQAVENNLNRNQLEKKLTDFEEIVFDNVYPLYGQCDIKGSSVARNNAIKEDLTSQLESVISITKKAYKFEKLPIYKELIFRTENYISTIEKGLKTGDEQSITNFLTDDVAPILKHFKSLDDTLKKSVKEYEKSINSQLKIVYQKRKEYEDYVTELNDQLATYIDKQQDEAQEMFPHYFERYKTDGVDFNMYIGQSLVKDKEYNELYLQNLRLWQLKLICELENIAYGLQEESDYSLEIASLILVHSAPLAIKFRMDEKQFDVDGAYNIRYEIIKKRIDKSHVKNTKERITQPHKVSIIYSQNEDKMEYMKYIEYLQSKGYLGTVIEDLEVEDLQGITGLKALRVAINYKSSKENISFEDLMNVIKEES